MIGLTFYIWQVGLEILSWVIVVVPILLLTLALISRFNPPKSTLPVRQNIQLWQFILSVLGLLIAFSLYINGIADRQTRVEMAFQAQQAQINELKQSTDQLKNSTDDIKASVADIRGDVKVLLSKMK